MTRGSRANQPIISLFSALAVQGAMVDVVLPLHEQLTGTRISATFEPSTLIVRHLEEGGIADVVVGTSESLDKLTDRELISATDRVPVARVGLGVGVANGAEIPEVSSVDLFVDTLLRARSVAYSRTGASGIYFSGLIERLGIAAEVNARATVIEQGYTGAVVVDGQADLAIQQTSELRFVRGLQVVGPLPADIQHYTQFDAATVASARDVKAGRALIKLLGDARIRRALIETGLEPLSAE
jgi:molybdate transport system substrate-binding protein